MQKSKFLYGCSPKEFADLPYKEALSVKLKKARETMHRVASEQEDIYNTGASREKFMQNEYRLTQIKRAIDHCETLLSELEA